MTDERLEQIRAAIAEKPIGELEHVLPELLEELDAVRAKVERFKTCGSLAVHSIARPGPPR